MSSGSAKAIGASLFLDGLDGRIARMRVWRAVDELIDWLMAKNQAGYQMVNPAARMREMEAFMRVAHGRDLPRVGWNGEGTGDAEELEAGMPGITRDDEGVRSAVPAATRISPNCPGPLITMRQLSG